MTTAIVDEMRALYCRRLREQFAPVIARAGAHLSGDLARAYEKVGSAFVEAMLAEEPALPFREIGGTAAEVNALAAWALSGPGSHRVEPAATDEMFRRVHAALCKRLIEVASPQ